MINESRYKKLLVVAIAVVAVAMAVYQMFSSRFLILESIQHQNIHLAFALVLLLLVAIQGARRRWQRLMWLATLVLSLVAVVYVQVLYDDLTGRFGYPENADIVIGVILFVVVLATVTRAFGPVFSAITLLVLGYALLGHLIPGDWQTFYTPAGKLIFNITTSLFDGIYGTLLGISANYLFLFILFGSLMQVSGATRFFEEVGRLLGRKLSGGAALSSVVTSALMGTVTGSPTANVVTTGAFTIPLMKKVGYKPEQAGAIEATASTGGMIMPPIMGSAAFIMASWTGIPYIRIAAMALLPAIFYFLSAGIYAQLQAMRMKVRPIDVRPDFREMTLSAPLFIIPLGLIILLLVWHFTLMYVIFWAIIALVVLSMVRKKTRPSLRQWLDAVVSGAKNGAQIAVSFATIGTVASIMMQTGLVIRMPGAIERLSGGNLAIALMISAVLAIILGMGLSATATYVVMALTVAPVLLRMGLAVEQAHLFAFYFAAIGMLTPPIAVAAAVAGKLAGASYFKTAIEAMKAGMAGIIVPFIMVLTPAIILLPQEPLWAVLGILSLLLIIIALQVGVCGHYIVSLGKLERVPPIAIGIVLFLSLVTQSYVIFSAGAAGFIIMSIWQLVKKRQDTRRVALARTAS